MAIKVGITGGIGSGKSYICGILEKMGYPVYYSDQASKRLTASSPIIRKGLIEIVGAEVFKDDVLNKTYLAQKLFYDDSVRKQVNGLIHPVVRADFNQWADAQNATIVFNEAAILIETGAFKTLDFTVVVTADREERIRRTMQRDGVERQEVLARMAKQMEDEEKIKVADFVVYNDDRPLLVQIDQMIAAILNSAKKK